MLLTMTPPIMVSCGMSESEFDKTLSEGFVMSLKTIYGNALAYDEIGNAWRNGIFYNTTPSGRYCRDFMDALNEIEDSLEEYGIKEDVKLYNDSLIQITSQLNPPPSSRKECHEDFVDIVSDIGKLKRSVLYPSGSYNDYTSNCKEIFDRLAEKMERFRIKYSEFLSQREE